jgi:hypothetical protein
MEVMGTGDRRLVNRLIEDTVAAGTPPSHSSRE